MNLHEYQGKVILKKFDVRVPEGRIAYTPEEAVEVASEIENQTGFDKWAVKAQIHAGGRGKGGGVKIAKSLEDVHRFASEILGMKLITPQTGSQGKLVRKIYIEQNIYYEGPSDIQEYYVSILLNRETGRHMIIYSPRGGMDIEAVAQETPELIFKEEIDPKTGLADFQCRNIAFNLSLKGDAFKNMTKFIKALYKAFAGSDSSLFEINPVIKTADDKIFAADAKVTIDDNALFRHREIAEMRDLDEEDPMEVQAGQYGLNFVKLDGNVGCMVNGAGLAMATMDVIKLSGGKPANFLDVGGSADAKRVEEAFRIITRDKNVKAILINIFGGIVRCDRVANGIVEACKNIGELKVPVIVRLQGTNAKLAKEIIDDSGLEVTAAVKLQDAADLIKEMVG
ncbi:MAG: ADP-forming succinate--CoA ligase subunit beta [Bacteroidales bacterium]